MQTGKFCVICPLFRWEPNIYGYMSSECELCSFGDFTYKLSAYIYVFQTGIVQYKDE